MCCDTPRRADTLLIVKNVYSKPQTPIGMKFQSERGSLLYGFRDVSWNGKAGMELGHKNVL